jgi:hypothetical protein
MLDLEPILKRSAGPLPERVILVHGEARRQTDWKAAAEEANADRGALLAEVERLRKVEEAAKNYVAAAAHQMDERYEALKAALL